MIEPFGPMTLCSPVCPELVSDSFSNTNTTLKPCCGAHCFSEVRSSHRASIFRPGVPQHFETTVPRHLRTRFPAYLNGLSIVFVVLRSHHLDYKFVYLAYCPSEARCFVTRGTTTQNRLGA